MIRRDSAPQLKEVELPVRSEKDYRSFAEQIAEHRIYECGKFVPELKAALPNLWRLWHVDRFFPYAKGGELLVDEPKTEADFVESKLKAAAAAKAGLRMIILKSDTSIQEAREQLDEVDHVLDDLRNGTKAGSSGRTEGQAAVPQTSVRRTKRHQ
jgi:hypothetical protein